MLAACRCLHADGYDVSMIAAGRPAAGHWSRCCAERLSLPSPVSDAVGFVEGLAGILERDHYGVLLPGGDAAVSAISRHRSRFEPHVRLGMPSHEAVERAVDKIELIRAATQAGLACPPTVACSGPDQVAAAARKFGLPVVVKPRRTVFELDGAPMQLSSRLACDEDRLAQLAPTFGDPCLLQQHEQGPIYSCSGVIVDGRMLAFATSRYARTYPVDGGPVAFARTVDPPSDLRERVGALLSLLGWQGIFEVELVRRADGSFGVIDMNPRVFGSLSLVVAAGARLPTIWCDWLLGRDPRPAVARAGVCYRWEDADARHLLWQLRRRRVRAGLAVARPHRRVAHAYFRRRDPAPLVARLLYMARSGIGRTWRRGTHEIAAAPTRAPTRLSLPVAGKSDMQRSAEPTVAIVGAGPYGLSAAAHLRHAGVRTRVFGEVMQFWHSHMPKGMVLRSRKRSSNISDPRRALTIDDYGAIAGDKMANASLSDFLGYGHWFQRQAVPDVDSRRVSRIERPGRFELTLDDGEVVSADRVVVAAGLAPFAWRPAPFHSLPPSLCSHSSEETDLGRFAGQQVVVIGAGQSALESGALLHEAGARAEVLVRAPAVWWLQSDSDRRSLSDRMLPPTDVGGRATGWIAALPDVFRRVPRRLQPVISYRCIRPAGAAWLIPRLTGVPITTGVRVTAAEHQNGRVRLALDDGGERVVDHVLLGTGYRIDVSRYAFLSEELVASVARVDGYPLLGPGLESSVPGLHFLGAPAALSFGPIMRFVVGTWYAAPEVARGVLGGRRRSLRFSF